MTLLDYLDASILDRQFKQGDFVVAHELGGDSTADQGGKLGGTTSNVLLRLHDSMLVVSTFRLDGNDELSSVSIDTDVNLIDLDLPDFLHRGSEVVLE